MYVFPVTVIEKVRREANSALPNAPVVPELEVPRRHPLRALRRWAHRTPQAVCEADRRDRSAQVASTASPC